MWSPQSTCRQGLLSQQSADRSENGPYQKKHPAIAGLLYLRAESETGLSKSCLRNLSQFINRIGHRYTGV